MPKNGFCTQLNTRKLNSKFFLTAGPGREVSAAAGALYAGDGAGGNSIGVGTCIVKTEKRIWI